MFPRRMKETPFSEPEAEMNGWMTAQTAQRLQRGVTGCGNGHYIHQKPPSGAKARVYSRGLAARVELVPFPKPY